MELVYILVRERSQFKQPVKDIIRKWFEGPCSPQAVDYLLRAGRCSCMCGSVPSMCVRAYVCACIYKHAMVGVGLG